MRGRGGASAHPAGRFPVLFVERDEHPFVDSEFQALSYRRQEQIDAVLEPFIHKILIFHDMGSAVQAQLKPVSEAVLFCQVPAEGNDFAVVAGLEAEENFEGGEKNPRLPGPAFSGYLFFAKGFQVGEVLVSSCSFLVGNEFLPSNIEDGHMAIFPLYLVGISLFPGNAR